MARLADRHETLDVVADQRGQPTWTMDVARADPAPRRRVARRSGCGTRPARARRTKFGLTREIFRELGLDPDRVRPTTSDAFPLPAPRPAYSVLGHDAWRMARLAPLPHWEASLAEALPDVVAEPPSS